MSRESTSGFLAEPVTLESDAHRKAMRHEILEQLRRHLNAVLSKRPGQVVALVGEAGVGKTFTLETLLRATPCKSICLQPTLTAAALVNALPTGKFPLWVESQLERLERGAMLPTPTLSEVLAAMLSALAPFVLVFEDMHDASPERLELVTQLARMVPRLRGAGLFVTSRANVCAPFKSYQLEHLDQTEMTALLETHSKTKLPEEGLEWVFKRSKGNPLFALEFWRTLSRQGYFWSDGSCWHWREPTKDFIPLTLKALIGEWVRNTAHSPEVQQVIEARAMMNNTPTDATWAGVTGLDEHVFREARAWPEQRGLIRRGDCHPLILEVIQETIPIAQKQVYAQRILTFLEASQLEPSPSLINNANLEKNRNLALYQRLARQAKEKNDVMKAGHWLALAAQQSQGEAQFKLALEAAMLLRHTDLAKATQMAQLAASLPPHNTEAVFLCAELWVTQGNTAHAEVILQLLPAQQRSGQRWWETMIRLHYTTHANYDEVLRLWQSRPDLQATAYPEINLFIGTILGQSGQFAEAYRLVGPLLTRSDLEPYLRCRVLGLHAILTFLQGDFITSEAYDVQAITLAKTLNRPAYLAQLLRNYAIDTESLNNYDGAVAHYREALVIYREHGLTLDFAFTQALLAQTLCDLGRHDEAEILLLESQDILERSDNTLYCCQCQGSLAALYLEWQPPYGGALAFKHAYATLSLARTLNNQEMIQAGLIYSAQAEVRFGNPQKALELGQEAIQEQVTGPSSVRKAWGALAWGLALEAVGKHEEALNVLLQASQHLEQDKMYKMAQRYGLEADRLTQNTEGARVRYQWFSEQGLHGGAKVALRYFPSLVVTQPATQIESVAPRLNVLGPSQLEKNGERLPYRGRKRLELLTYLLETRISGRAEAPLLDLMDALYPEVGEAESKAVIKQLVYLLRNQLGSKAIVSTSSGYALGKLMSDVEVFLETGDTALWRGSYLAGLGSWYPSVREALLQSLERKAFGLVTTDPKEAARVGRFWLEMEPYDLQVVRLLVQAYEAAGEPKVAEQLYQESRKQMQEVSEDLPPSRQAFLSESAKVA